MSDLKQRVEEFAKQLPSFTSTDNRLRLTAFYESHIKELMERETKLVEALQFYANAENYWDDSSETMEVRMGENARATLKSLGIEGEG